MLAVHTVSTECQSVVAVDSALRSTSLLDSTRAAQQYAHQQQHRELAGSQWPQLGALQVRIESHFVPAVPACRAYIFPVVKNVPTDVSAHAR